MTDRRPELPAIEVSAEVAAEAGMPDDLDANVLGPYEVPDPARRRRAGFVYLGAAALTAIGMALGLPAGMWVIVAVFLAIGVYHFLAGAHLAVGDTDALNIANAAMDFPVGHASAVLGFDGLLARPTWNVLVFSADEPPTQRGLVRVDGRSGDVVETYTEPVPPAEQDKTADL
ncbi:MAG: hypothetical protein QNJ81_10175 [Acidimicrobiia bacterium]|nr:hypothetical protein [Acidimicrobiia bacterium]